MTVTQSSQPTRVVFLGDSITGVSNLRDYLKFSHIVELMIRAKNGPGSVVTFNRGIGGDTSGGVLARLDRDVLAVHPNIVVLLIGGNDAYSESGIGRDSTLANIDAIVIRIRAEGAKILMLQYHVLPNPERPEMAMAHLPTNNDLIAAVAAAHDLPTLDMAAPILEAAKTYPLAELVNETDGVHLSPGGELVFADTIFAKLVDLGWV